MITISIVFSRGTAQLSIDEAKELVCELNEKIESAERQLHGGVHLIDDAYLNRAGVYDFFRQFLPEASISNRAGKLFAAIVRSSMEARSRRLRDVDPLPLAVLCGECKLPLEGGEECAVMRTWHGHTHYNNVRDYLVPVSLLSQYKQDFLVGGSHELQGKKLGDFQLLMDAL